MKRTSRPHEEWACPSCGGHEYEIMVLSMSGRFGFSFRTFDAYVCRECQHTEFYLRR